MHIQLNLDDSVVAIINRTYSPKTALTAGIRVLDMNSKLLFSENKTISLKSTDVEKSISLSKILSEEKGISFVVLNLKNASGKTISQNTYWFSPEHNFNRLKEMPSSKMNVKILKTATGKNETQWTLQFTNPANRLAFFINPQILQNGKEIFPSFWSDNYFSLSPNESTTVQVTIPNVKIKDTKVELAVSAWNVEKELIPLK
jgi:hypothetical protein